MHLADVIERYRAPLQARHGARLLPGHRRALDALAACRTSEAGQVLWGCGDCRASHATPKSCGHRSCPRCQNHQTSEWLERQRSKLLPVDYFMVTFTLPAGLRGLAWRHQRTVFDALMRIAAGTLRDFARNPAKLGGEIGLTTVLHTHARNLDFHPHCHVIVPGGAVDAARGQWRTAKGRYLFNAFALARVFRARMLQALDEAGLAPPAGLPDKWVVHCKRVGRGAPALDYLGRYLYRGVIGEASIVDDRDGQVTFRYTDGRTGEIRTRTLAGEDFLRLVLQHVLPRRFRRVRDHGFLHGNARRLLTLVQRVLCVRLPAPTARPRPVIACPQCRSAMHVIAVYRPRAQPG